ncbi:MAG TPA: hypothetical protein VGM74_05370 [Burkholderiaceae bacterium]
MRFSLIRTYRYLIIGTVAIVTACGGGGSSDSSTTTSSSSSGSSTNCSYTDLVSASERAQASACGVQVSANYAQADSGLASVIAACQQGQKSTADAYYDSTYRQMVSYARSVSSTLSCGTNTAPTLPNTSNQTYYNVCVKSASSGGTITYSSACYGPVQQGVGGCGSAAGYTYLSQSSSQSACVSAGSIWAHSH